MQEKFLYHKPVKIKEKKKQHKEKQRRKCDMKIFNINYYNCFVSNETVIKIKVQRR